MGVIAFGIGFLEWMESVGVFKSWWSVAFVRGGEIVAFGQQ